MRKDYCIHTPFGTSDGGGELVILGVRKYTFKGECGFSSEGDCLAVSSRLSFEKLTPYTRSKSILYRERFWFDGIAGYALPFLELAERSNKLKVHLGDWTARKEKLLEVRSKYFRDYTADEFYDGTPRIVLDKDHPKIFVNKDSYTFAYQNSASKIYF